MIIVAYGTSLAGLDLNRLQGLGHVLAVKGALFDIPWADAGFGLDMPRLREWKDRLKDVTMPVWWAVPDEFDRTDYPTVRFLRRERGEILSSDPGMIHSGGSSGFGALSFAVLTHAREIVLFGFDYAPVEIIVARNRRGAPKLIGMGWHSNEDNYGQKRHQWPMNWQKWSEAFSAVKPDLDRRGVHVVNASPNSLITAFEKMTHDEAIEYLDRLRPA